MKTTQGSKVGRWIVTTGGALALGLTLGLDSGAADTNDYQPGDAGGHATADLQATNERQAGAVARATNLGWAGDAAGFGAGDLLAVNERQSAGITRTIAARPVIVLGDAGGYAETDLRNANARQVAGIARSSENDVVASTSYAYRLAW
jgi:hypothetical protein